MTHVKALQAGHSSQGTSEPITPVCTWWYQMTQEMATGFPWQRPLAHGPVAPGVVVDCNSWRGGGGLWLIQSTCVSAPSCSTGECGGVCQDCVHSEGIIGSPAGGPGLLFLLIFVCYYIELCLRSYWFPVSLIQLVYFVGDYRHTLSVYHINSMMASGDSQPEAERSGVQNQRPSRLWH